MSQILSECYLYDTYLQKSPRVQCIFLVEKHVIGHDTETSMHSLNTSRKTVRVN